MELNFNRIFIITMTALSMNGTNPLKPRDKIVIGRLICTLTVYTTVFLFFMNSVKCDLTRRDYSAACRNGCLSVVFFAISFQLYTTLINRKILIKLINTMKEDYEKIKSSPDDAEVVIMYAKKGGWVTQLWLLTAGVAFAIFPIKNIVLYLVQYIKGDDFKLIPFYVLTYPEIIDKNQNNIIIYLVTYTCLIFYAAFSSTTYIAFVPLGPMFMLHACGQLELITKRISKLFDGSLSAREINAEFSDIIRHYQFIYGYVSDIQACFGIIYELIIRATAIILPITTFEILEAFNEGEFSIDFIMFVVGGIVLSATPCYYSDKLMEQGEKVRQEIYSCGWERQYDRRTRSTLLLLLTRAIRPMALRTMFRTVCLDALTDLFQQAYAIFNLMNAVFA